MRQDFHSSVFSCQLSVPDLRLMEARSSLKCTAELRVSSSASFSISVCSAGSASCSSASPQMALISGLRYGNFVRRYPVSRIESSFSSMYICTITGRIEVRLMRPVAWIMSEVAASPGSTVSESGFSKCLPVILLCPAEVKPALTSSSRLRGESMPLSALSSACMMFASWSLMENLGSLRFETRWVVSRSAISSMSLREVLRAPGSSARKLSGSSAIRPLILCWRFTPSATLA